ncbi:MAG: DsbA family protein [Alphaproteobacteria bacterium]|nr:MAG: DsbA family protein [Alphaproteobacteria bacterium]
MRRKLLIGLGSAAVVAAGGLWFGRRGGQTGALPALDIERVAASATDTQGVVDMALGAADAPVTVVEYASFTCPHCRRFHEEVFPQIRKNYIDTGKVRFILREVYFDRYGLWAAMVARCDGGMRYFGMVDLIFDKQREWTQGEPAEVAANLRKLGRLAGLSDEKLDACLQDGETAKALVAAYQTNAQRDGIEGTPTFIINGEKYSNMGYEDFARVLDEKLGA